MNKNIPHIICQWLLVISFSAIILLPGLKMVFSERVDLSFTEKRILSKFPQAPQSLAQLQSFFNKVSIYLDDHFGFRDFFIYRYQREVRKRFGITGSQTIVYQGTDSWLYLSDSKILSDYAGKYPLSRSDMQIWKEKYQQKKRWLAQRDIEYLLIAAPNKQSVYPEYLMQQWQQNHRPGRLAQLRHAFPEITKRELLNLDESLQKVKNSGQLFYKSDTHWTPYGAYQAYLFIAAKTEALFPDEIFRRDFSFTTPQAQVCAPNEKQRCGDLAEMLLDFAPITEQLKILKPYRAYATPVPPTYTFSNLPKEIKEYPTLVRRCSGKKLKALIFRDSFFNAIEPFLSENFNEAVYIWKPYDQKNVEEILNYFRPDIVIEERVERDFFKEHL